MSAEGVRIERRATDFIAETQTLRPLRDTILVKPLKWEPSKLIEVAGNQRKPLRGVVIAVGPGYREKRRYRNAKGEVNRIGETGRVTPCDVKVGDVVELGGLELNGYDFPTVSIGHELHVIASERDVCGVVTE